MSIADDEPDSGAAARTSGTPPGSKDDRLLELGSRIHELLQQLESATGAELVKLAADRERTTAEVKALRTAD